MCQTKITYAPSSLRHLVDLGRAAQRLCEKAVDRGDYETAYAARRDMHEYLRAAALMGELEEYVYLVHEASD